jgi:hypothetical protein
MSSLKTCILVIFVLLARPQGQLVLASGRGKLKLEVYQVDRVSLIGPMVDGMVLDLAKNPRVSIKASGKSFLQNLRISSISFYVDDKWISTDTTIPSWFLLGYTTGSWTPTVGMHTIKAVGIRGFGRKKFESLVRVNVIDTRTKAPTLQVTAPTPIAAPVTSPVVGPMPSLDVAPNAAPFSTVASPKVAPTPPSLDVAPKAAPFCSVAYPPSYRGYLTGRPMPPAAPSLCVSNVVQYINSITLSNQTLSESGVTLLDDALRQLLLSNARLGVQLSQCNETRLRQRYAYFALACSTGIVGKLNFTDDDECSWEGVTCTNDGTVTELKLNNKNMTGRIPADVGLWTGLTRFSVAGNGLSGPLPNSTGEWTSLFYLDISSNRFTGSLPMSIGAWTRIVFFNVSMNQFSGTIPINFRYRGVMFLQGNSFSGTMPTDVFNGYNCPRLREYSIGFARFDLWADCQELECACCNYCCDTAGMNCVHFLPPKPPPAPTAAPWALMSPVVSPVDTPLPPSLR